MDPERIEQEFSKLAGSPGVSLPAVNAIKDWLLASETVQRVRIHSHEIASASGQPLDEIVSAILIGVAMGLFDLHWLVHCPHCNMITTDYDKLFELSQISNCKMCDVEFEADFLNHVEVTFSLNKLLEDIEMEAFCLPPPVLESKINLAVLPGESGKGADVINEPGVYRYFCPITLAKGVLRVRKEATDTIQKFKIRQLPSLRFDPNIINAHCGPIEFELVNDCEKISGIFIIRDDLPDELALGEMPPRLTGLQVIHYPEYQHLFGDHVLSDQEQVLISSVTLMFTDIAGSTEMYETVGDAAAYNLVHHHFELLFDSIEAQNGFVVKTIGDAVMASFLNNDDAIKCSLDALRGFHRLNTESDSQHGIRVKFGIHRGPVMLVNLNGRKDYFGSTVNKAARIQNCAGAGEIAFSLTALTDSRAADALMRLSGDEIREERVTLKGILDDQTIFRLNTTNKLPDQDTLGF